MHFSGTAAIHARIATVSVAGSPVYPASVLFDFLREGVMSSKSRLGILAILLVAMVFAVSSSSAAEKNDSPRLLLAMCGGMGMGGMQHTASSSTSGNMSGMGCMGHDMNMTDTTTSQGTTGGAADMSHRGGAMKGMNHNMGTTGTGQTQSTQQPAAVKQ